MDPQTRTASGMTRKRLSDLPSSLPTPKASGNPYMCHPKLDLGAMPDGLRWVLVGQNLTLGHGMDPGSTLRLAGMTMSCAPSFTGELSASLTEGARAEGSYCVDFCPTGMAPCGLSGHLPRKQGRISLP